MQKLKYNSNKDMKNKQYEKIHLQMNPKPASNAYWIML